MLFLIFLVIICFKEPFFQKAIIGGVLNVSLKPASIFSICQCLSDYMSLTMGRIIFLEIVVYLINLIFPDGLLFQYEFWCFFRPMLCGQISL